MSDERLRFVPAASVSLEEYAAGFTASFVGYHFNLTLDAARLARKIRVEQHDLQHSLVAYEGDALVGALYDELSTLLEDLGRLEAFFGQLRPVDRQAFG